jgi:hypothetical protein
LDVEGDLLGLEVMGLGVLRLAVGLTINPDAKLGFNLVGGLGSPLMQAPLICPPNEPLQHNS